MKHYPRIGDYTTGFSNMRKTCQECSKPNRKCLVIEVNYFRGDDDVFNICPECKKKKTEDELLNIKKPQAKPLIN